MTILTEHEKDLAIVALQERWLSLKKKLDNAAELGTLELKICTKEEEEVRNLIFKLED